ncbi:MAG: hypothetical protein P4L22_01355 [Candidatus Babeliales bacterium]|nr:hypothetical protein [Candidatus Babeliales bacterium]
MKKLLFSLILGLGLISRPFKVEAITITLGNKALSTLIALPFYLKAINANSCNKAIHRFAIDKDNKAISPKCLYGDYLNSFKKHSSDTSSWFATGLLVNLVSYILLNKYSNK